MEYKICESGDFKLSERKRRDDALRRDPRKREKSLPLN
jgi:hypothetical protein